MVVTSEPRRLGDLRERTATTRRPSATWSRGRCGKKRKILVAQGAYHGAQPWANHLLARNPRGRARELPDVHLQRRQPACEKSAAACSGDLAAVVGLGVQARRGLTTQELCDPSFARAVREVCDAEGAALILDDVRAGLRLSLDASWSVHGVQPDLSAWGKGLANGEPVAAVLGSEAYRESARRIFVTGSFWYQAAPFAAALATLDVLEEMDGPTRMFQLGQAFRVGLEEQAQRYGHPLLQSGPPQMPTVMFEDDPKFEKGLTFCEHALANGIYLHPWHNMFLSVAHTERDIEQALAATARAFQELG